MHLVRDVSGPTEVAPYNSECIVCLHDGAVELEMRKTNASFGSGPSRG